MQQIYDWGGEAQVDCTKPLPSPAGSTCQFSTSRCARWQVAGVSRGVLSGHTTGISGNARVGIWISRACSHAFATTSEGHGVDSAVPEETERRIAFRSYLGFQTEFCNPAWDTEKGAKWVTFAGTVGCRFRRRRTWKSRTNSYEVLVNKTNNGGSRAKQCQSGGNADLA